MASRETLQEAEELAEQLRHEYPDDDIRIIDATRVQPVSPTLAGQHGWEVVEERPDPQYPLVRVPEFRVVRILRCAQCGAEFEDLAFGEIPRRYCRSCQDRIDDERRAESARRAAEERRRIAWADRYMRDGGSGWGVD